MNYYCPHCNLHLPAEQTREVDFHALDFVRVVGREIVALPRHIRRVRLRMHSIRRYQAAGGDKIGCRIWTDTCGPVRRVQP